jgi:hypothetical protein
MASTYTALGLALRSQLPLPGMTPAMGEGLPGLDLELRTPAELDEAWSGGGAAGPWRGRLGDGEELTIEWGRERDLLLSYGERARFLLDPSGESLLCAPREPAALDWQRVLLSRVLPNVSVARGREALHASAVDTPLGVVAIAAPSGTGKSTLASELIRRGWPLFADDVLTLGRGGEEVEAYPSAPHMNVDPDDIDFIAPPARRETLGILSGERWVAVEEATRGPRPVAAIFLFERSPLLPLGAEPLHVSPLTLVPFMLGLPDERGREAPRFALYSDLVESARMLRLTADLADSPADIADTVERALNLPAQSDSLRPAPRHDRRVLRF